LHFFAIKGKFGRELSIFSARITSAKLQNLEKESKARIFIIFKVTLCSISILLSWSSITECVRERKWNRERNVAPELFTNRQQT